MPRPAFRFIIPHMSWGNSWNRWAGAEGPMFTLGQFRVDLTTLLVGVHTLAMALVAVGTAAGLGGWVAEGVLSHAYDIFRRAIDFAGARRFLRAAGV